MRSRRIAARDRREVGCQYGGAPWRRRLLAARRRGDGRSPPRCRTELQVTVAELARVCPGPGRATDLAQWTQRLLDEGAPPGRLVGAIQWSQFWARDSGDEILV